MNRLKNIFSKFKCESHIFVVIAALSFSILFPVKTSWAWSQDYSKYCGFLAENRDKTETREKFDTDETKKKVEQVNKVEDKLENFCKKLKSHMKALKDEKSTNNGEKDFDDEIYRQQGVFKTAEVEDASEYIKRFNKIIAGNPVLKQEYEGIQKEYEAAAQELKLSRDNDLAIHEDAVKAGEYQPCGQHYPRGCPDGKVCFKKYERSYNAAPGVGGAGSYAEYHNTFVCIDPKSKDAKNTKKYTKVLPGEDTTEVHEYISTQIYKPIGDIRTTISETGERKVNSLSDRNCRIARMQGYYQSKCYACVIVKTLLETFLVACSQVYDLTSEAGSKILVVGALIWLAFFALKNVSSFANIEPGAMVNTLFVFLFKIMVAYIIINSGLTTIIHYTINPIVTAGADYGLGLMSTMQDTSGVADHYKDYNKALYDAVVPTIKSVDGKTTSDIISADVINKIMLFTFNLDKTVSTNLVIGHALTCHSMNAGAWNLGLFHMVNIWIWFCGAAIWFCGFMLTLGICYYLLDISFKLGFAIIALPVVIGLWPFNITKNKLPQTISIILSSAATFAFLALTTTYALMLISVSLRDKDALLAAIENEKVDWISDTFDISGPYFIIIMFAYLYSIKLIGSTISDYVDKFFSDGIFGGQSPMHSKMTQVTDFAKQKVTGAATAAGGAIAGKAGKGVEKVLGKAVGFVRNKFKAKDKAKDKDKGSNPVSSAGKAAKNTGKTMEQSGKATEQAGKAAEKGGKMMSKGGDGMMQKGKALSSTGWGAIVGVPMMIAGGAVKGAGTVTQYAGKATKKAGQAMKKSGKTMKKIGERMEKAGDKMEKTGNNLKYGKDSADNNPPSDNK